MKIEINSKKFGEQVVLIDDEDYDKIKDKSLSLFKSNRSNHGEIYVRTSWIEGKRFLLHRYLTNCPEKKLVDHINGNTLDNRKQNLRICEHSENRRNLKQYKTNKKSKYKGVFLKKNYIVAVIGYNNKVIHLGHFKTEKEAAIAYNEAAIKYHGEFANLNFF